MTQAQRAQYYQQPQHFGLFDRAIESPALAAAPQVRIMLKLKELTNDSEAYVRKAAADAITLIETYQLAPASSVVPLNTR